MAVQTAGKVPAIRFIGFNGDWDGKELGQLFPITSAARVHKSEWTKSGVPFFRSSDVVSYFKGENNTKAFISVELYEELSTKVGRIKKGDILVTGGGSIGIPFFVNNDNPLYFKDADLLWFKIREAADSRYLYTFLCSWSFRQYLKSISHIGTIAHYTVEQAKGTPLALPRDQREQTRIGEYFRELDSLIWLHQRKHDKLMALKKAMLQQMFPQPGATAPEIRFKGFSGDWVEHEFKQIASRTSQPAYEAHLPRIEYEDILSGEGCLNKDVFKKASTKAGINFDRGDVLFGKLRPYLKNWWLAEFTGIAVGDFWVLRSAEATSSFIYYLIQTEAFERVANQSSGSKMPRSDWKLVSSTVFRIPMQSEEQIQIGTYFRSLDVLISQHATQLQKLQQIKSACLERMFV